MSKTQRARERREGERERKKRERVEREQTGLNIECQSEKILSNKHLCVLGKINLNFQKHISRTLGSEQRSEQGYIAKNMGK